MFVPWFHALGNGNSENIHNKSLVYGWFVGNVEEDKGEKQEGHAAVLLASRLVFLLLITNGDVLAADHFVLLPYVRFGRC